MKILLALLALVILAGPAEAKRSHVARCHFLASQGYPDCRTPKGYIVDHIKPLACGGADTPANMQLQTLAEARAKDKWERKGCRSHS